MKQNVKSKVRETRLPLRLQVSGGRYDRHTAFLRRHLLRGHKLLRSPLRDLSVALVGDATMASLHEQFLAVAGPTDVLTFELEMGPSGRVTAGEVIVCVPEARRRAKEHASSVEKELLLYALHGMLHLSGFDDRTDSDYRKMHRKEDEILSRLGIGPVFAAGRRVATGAT